MSYDNKQREVKRINLLWIILVLLTLFSAYIAEQVTPGLGSIVTMSIVLAIKGRIIVDYFMELRHTHIVLRTLMRLYFIIIPAMIILVYLFPDYIAYWSAL